MARHGTDAAKQRREGFMYEFQDAWHYREAHG